MSRSSLFGLNAAAARPEPRADVASWYTPGWSDAFGDRLLMFDNTSASGLELLRFSPALGEAPGFESALRAAVDDMRGFEDAGVAVPRSVRWLGDREGLALVSTHIAGRRLSEMLEEARGAGFASELVRQLAPVLAALHAHRAQLAHGTLTPARVLVTAGGRLVLAEVPVGAALNALRLPAEQLRQEYGLAVRGDEWTELDQQQDIVQLGHTAMSLLVGRSLPAGISPDKLALLLDHQSAMPWGPGFIHLRSWLERALHLREPFASAAEAADALDAWPEGELPAHERRPRLVVTGTVEPRARTADVRPVLVSAPAGDATQTFPEERAMAPEPSVPFRTERIETPHLPTAPPAPEPALVTDAASTRPAWAKLLVAVAALEFVIILVLATMLWRSDDREAATIAAATLAPTPTTPPEPPASTAARTNAAPSVPAPTTGRLEVTSDPPGARVSVDGSARGTTPTTLTLAPGEHAVVLTAGQATTRRTVTISAGATSTLMASLGAVGSAGGWISFDTPLELQVSEGGTLLGTTRASRLMLPAGTHRLELTNPTLGVQDTLTVDVQAGRTVAARIAVPNGTVSLNALPWANVWLDNQPLGTTPLANVSVPVGTHEVIWRHPQFGERRQSVVVTTRAPVRVVADLTK